MNAPVLCTLLICDLADSTAMVEKLGDRRAADLMRSHDRISRDLVQRHGGREIDKTDGFLILFERPVQAVAFALDYQQRLRQLGEENSTPLRARVGIHVGEVVLWENEANDIARGAKHIEVEGIAKSVAARLMGVARPGQILLSAIAYNLAQRALSELGDEKILRWRAHGNYRFKGVLEPVEIYEVGLADAALFKSPAWSGKAHREIPWWRRPGMLAIEAAVLIAAIAAASYLSLRSGPAIAFAERDWVVVGDLKNQTGQSVLDDSLDTAFRISLEQSRYVNLLPSLQMSDALKRMQKPAGTKIDRVIGAEIAIREGARALILPSVAEVGGHVRVTAEVIDPHSQATVYAETADGTGIDSILPSVGQVSGQLRARLGEALASVKSNNAPLPKVTTANLDALRAYALGLQAYAAGRRAEALDLFQQATTLDPEFALAYIGMARIYTGSEDSASASIYIKKALALRDHLPARDQLYLDAWAARSGPLEPMLKKWRLLGQVYPDYYAAAYNYAYFAWHLENRAADAIQAIQPALSEHNPQRGDSYFTLAALEVADGQYDVAEQHFKKANLYGARTSGGAIAASYAAQRRYAQASQVLSEARSSGFPASDLFISLEKVAVQVDQGNWQDAKILAQAAVDEARRVGPFYERIFRAMRLSLDDYLEPAANHTAALQSLMKDLRNAGDDVATPNYADDMFAELFCAYIAARDGETKLAKATLDAISPQAVGSGYPNITHMLAILDAELALKNGDATAAVSKLQLRVDGTELYLTHIVLSDAFAAAGRYEDSLKEAAWLIAHRGRAYMETNSLHVLMAYNVAESTTAQLRVAELDARLGRQAAQDQATQDFLAAWPESKQPAFIKQRLLAIKH